MQYIAAESSGAAFKLTCCSARSFPRAMPASSSRRPGACEQLLATCHMLVLRTSHATAALKHARINSAACPVSHWRQQDSLVAEATASFGDAAMAREVPHPFVSPSNSPAVVQVLEAAIPFRNSVQCVHPVYAVPPGLCGPPGAYLTYTLVLLLSLFIGNQSPAAWACITTFSPLVRGRTPSKRGGRCCRCRIRTPWRWG